MSSVFRLYLFRMLLRFRCFCPYVVNVLLTSCEYHVGITLISFYGSAVVLHLYLAVVSLICCWYAVGTYLLLACR